MNISHVKISNYRSLKDVSTEVSLFTCIIGENNAGKSTFLLALSLFFSGTSLSQRDFYDAEDDITIELTFEDLVENDFLRLVEDHASRIKDIVYDNKLVLVRRYGSDGKSKLLCRRMIPKNSNLSVDYIGSCLKGKRGSAIEKTLIEELPEYQEQFNGLTTITAAKERIEQIAMSLPQEEQIFDIAPLPTGIDNSISNFLPEPIFIAGVKDLKDDVKTKESATFGKLLSILLKFLENAQNFQAIVDSFDKLDSLLNISIGEDGTRIDNRLNEIKRIEKHIEGFLQENFPKSAIELLIPKPELKQIFYNTQIFVDDGFKDVIETKGDGIKRALTFALLRTYVDLLKEHKKKIEEAQIPIEQPNEAEKISTVFSQPYLFLYEEPELYLHPSAQKILFDALENLTTSGNQVVVTTHSPSFFSPDSTGVFIKVRKEYPVEDKIKPFGRLLTIDIFRELSVKDAFQLICYENNTAAFFAERIFLVEGDSDFIYLKALAKQLNVEWNFDHRNIPVIMISGKSNIKRFKNFFQKFDIEVHVLLDADAAIDGFEHLEANDDISKVREALLTELDLIADRGNISGDISRNKVKELARRYSWRERYDKLKVFATLIKEGRRLTDEQIEEIDFLFSEETLLKRRQVFIDPTLRIPKKFELLKLLREQNIYILSNGAVEDYYPDRSEGRDKPSKALHAVRNLQTICDNCRTPQAPCENEIGNFENLQNICEIRAILPTISINDRNYCELDLIFSKLFA